MGRKHFQLFLVIAAAILSVLAYNAYVEEYGVSRQCGSLIAPIYFERDDPDVLYLGFGSDSLWGLNPFGKTEGTCRIAGKSQGVKAIGLTVGTAFVFLLLWLSRRREVRDVAAATMKSSEVADQ